MIVAVAGHRPQKLGGYHENPFQDWIKDQMKSILQRLAPEKVIVGGALGVDTWAAFIAADLKIPFLVAIPFLGQESRWPAESVSEYKRMLSLAAETKIISDGGYAPWKMQTRNKWMTDNCDKLIAVWDGSDGGTGNCVKYAQQVKKEIVFIDPRGYHD